MKTVVVRNIKRPNPELVKRLGAPKVTAFWEDTKAQAPVTAEMKEPASTSKSPTWGRPMSPG